MDALHRTMRESERKPKVEVMKCPLYSSAEHGQGLDIDCVNITVVQGPPIHSHEDHLGFETSTIAG